MISFKKALGKEKMYPPKTFMNLCDSDGTNYAWIAIHILARNNTQMSTVVEI